jgi:hypothetical protein
VTWGGASRCVGGGRKSRGEEQRARARTWMGCEEGGGAPTGLTGYRGWTAHCLMEPTPSAVWVEEGVWAGADAKTGFDGAPDGDSGGGAVWYALVRAPQVPPNVLGSRERALFVQVTLCTWQLRPVRGGRAAPPAALLMFSAASACNPPVSLAAPAWTPPFHSSRFNAAGRPGRNVAASLHLSTTSKPASNPNHPWTTQLGHERQDKRKKKHPRCHRL